MKGTLFGLLILFKLRAHAFAACRLPISLPCLGFFLLKYIKPSFLHLNFNESMIGKNAMFLQGECFTPRRPTGLTIITRPGQYGPCWCTASMNTSVCVNLRALAYSSARSYFLGNGHKASGLIGCYPLYRAWRPPVLMT